MQAWLCEPTQTGIRPLDGPRDRLSGRIIPPNPPASPNLSVSQSRVPGGPFRRLLNQAGPRTHSTVLNQPGRDSNVSQDRVRSQPLPPTSIPMQDSFNNDDALWASYISPYAGNLDLYQPRLGHFSPSVGYASELSDSSGTPRNTPELSSSSRNSSISAIADGYLPGGGSNYGTFQSIPDSPYQNQHLNISSTSSPYTPSSSGNQSGSSHIFRDTASDEAYKVIIRDIKAGVTHEDLSELLRQKMRLYVQHKEPKQGEDNKWSVEFSKEEDAEEAKRLLHKHEFKGRKLKVHVSNGGSLSQINSGNSTSSAASSTVTPGPIIIDGSVTG